MSRGRRRSRPGTSAREPAREVDGLLVIDKPEGLSSAEVVARVKRLLRARRAGHAGTLDPMATGVLLVCLGSATRLAAYLLADDKGYEGELELGVETDTLDREGRVSRRCEREARSVEEAVLASAMARFVGPIEQVPPMYSALKRDGRPLYELARTGKTVEREARPVRIEKFELLEYRAPRARFAVECSKGTYVRSLVADLGQALGCGAHLTELRRTRSGRFHVSDAVQVDDIRSETINNGLITPAEIAGHFPAYTVPEDLVYSVSCGRQLRWVDAFEGVPCPTGICRLVTASGALLALARVEVGRLRFERVFALRA